MCKGKTCGRPNGTQPQVTFAFEDELGEDSFETSFFNVLLERTETE